MLEMPALPHFPFHYHPTRWHSLAEFEHQIHITRKRCSF